MRDGLTQGLLALGTLLDLLQGLSTGFRRPETVDSPLKWHEMVRYHYLPIQLAGFVMCLALFRTLTLLPKSDRRRVAITLFALLCGDLAVTAGLHNG